MNTEDLLNQLSQSGLLTVLGMGIVFAFLIVLVFFMNLVALFIKKTGLDKTKEEKVSARDTPVKTGDQQEIIAAIATAIHEKK